MGAELKAFPMFLAWDPEKTAMFYMEYKSVGTGMGAAMMGSISDMLSAEYLGLGFLVEGRMQVTGENID